MKAVSGMSQQWQPEPGPDQFARLEPSAQDNILGQAAGAAYRAGAIRLEDVVGRSWSRDWGFTRRVKSLREVVGKEEAKQWSRATLMGVNKRQALGADLNVLVQLRNTRLNELQTMQSEAITALVDRVQTSRSFPKAKYHCEQHGAEFGVTDPNEYRRMWAEFVRRSDLRIATGLREKDRARMWYFVDVDKGWIAQYNESRQMMFSFYRVNDWELFEQHRALGWIEVRRANGAWEYLPWQR